MIILSHVLNLTTSFLLFSRAKMEYDREENLYLNDLERCRPVLHIACFSTTNEYGTFRPPENLFLRYMHAISCLVLFHAWWT